MMAARSWEPNDSQWTGQSLARRGFNFLGFDGEQGPGKHCKKSWNQYQRDNKGNEEEHDHDTNPFVSLVIWRELRVNVCRIQFAFK